MQNVGFKMQDKKCKIQNIGCTKVFLCFVSYILYIVFIIFHPAIGHSALPPFWTSGQTISLGQAISTEVDSCSIGDKIYVVWCDDRTGKKEIFFRSSDDAGQTWDREERLTDTSDESCQPAIACDDKNIYVVWREKNGKKSHIYYKYHNGEKWSDKVLISSDFNESGRPDIAITTVSPNSYLYIVWESVIKFEGREKTSVYLVRSTDNGRSFSSPEPIIQGDWETKEPSIFCGARDAYIAWSDNREGVWNVFFRRWGEIQRSPEVKLSTIPNCSFPYINGIEPSIYVLWQCVETGSVYNDIYMSYSFDFGGSWSNVSRLTNGEAESVYPKIAALTRSDRRNDHQVWFFWQDGRNGEWGIFFSTYQYGDDKASKPDSIVSTDKPSILPNATVTSGQVHLFWTHIESDMKSSIFYMYMDTLPPKPPGTPSHFDLSSNPGYDDDKTITFKWSPSQSSEPVKYNIYVSINGDEFKLIADTDRPYYDLTGESGKSYRIYVEAVDRVGNVSVPSHISEKVICDPDAPEVSIHSPKSNSTIRGDVPIIISAYDENFLSAWIEYGESSFPSSWELLAGPFYKNLDREQVLLWDTGGLNGRYTIRLVAIDRAGNESKIETFFNIDSRPPTSIIPGEIEQITPSEINWVYTTPSWSPYNDRIIFSSNEGGTFDLWTVSLDSRSRSRLTRSTDIERCPDWSPNGDMIVFESIPAMPKSEIEQLRWKLWIISSNGKNLRQITFGDGSDNNPAWSPDGSSIAFDSDIDGDREIFLITNMNKVINGAQPIIVKLTNNKWDDTNPRWSLDGSKIIFQSNSRGSYDIMEMNIDGTNVRSLISTPADEIEPSLSPDGKWILYSIRSDDKYEIKAVSYPDQMKEISLSMSGIDARKGQWSPKMDMVIYESQGAIFVTNIVHPLGDLEAFIASPKGGDILSGKVDIKGIAKGKNFSHYSLFYLPPNSDVFQQIGGDSTSQVKDIGFLGKWDTEEIEGRCLLKLVAYGKNNEQATDSVWVMVSNRLPFIAIDEPQNGTITGESIINVKGRAEPKATVLINDIPIKLSEKGEFSQKIQLSEGLNKIIAKAIIKSDKTKEWTVERTVILDTKPPKLVVESPVDFQVVKLPYVIVKGSVDEKAEVNILSARVWLSDNGSFERRVAIKEGVNVISISAFDSLGRYTSVERRVIYQKETSITSDIFAPAITDVYPERRAIVTSRSFRISARIVDDIGLDPSSIKFWFDDNEIGDYELDIGSIDEDQVVGVDQYPKILISYSPKLPISEGEHSFKIRIKDTSGNLAEDTFNFTVDISPPRAIVSAFLLDSLNRIRIAVVPNKNLSSISSISVKPCEETEYSISSITQKDGYYEAFFDITPSQKNIVIDFNAKTYLGSDIQAQGYLAWNTARLGEVMRLGSKDNAQFISEPINIRTGNLLMTLRSQDGLSADALAVYENDANFRRLKLTGLIYILSTYQEFKGGEIQGVLGLPTKTNLTSVTKNLVMFHWDDNQKQWEPLDKIGVSNSILSSRINGVGTYALFADVDPPIIKDIFPKDANEVPLDRFFVSANIFDIGSGISEIKLVVDNKVVKYEYNRKTGQLLYFPSELDWGFHKIDITAVDRAGNVAVYSSSFVTKEIFKFISVKAYPNPSKDRVNIDFKLTKSAEVVLNIYTLLGNLVYDDRKSDIAHGIFEWKGVNNSGNKVASGVYIYKISAKIFHTEIHEQGKIAIYR